MKGVNQVDMGNDNYHIVHYIAEIVRGETPVFGLLNQYLFMLFILPSALTVKQKAQVNIIVTSLGMINKFLIKPLKLIFNIHSI